MLGTMKAELILIYVQGQVIFISYEIVINFIRQAKPNLESKMPAIVLTTSVSAEEECVMLTVMTLPHLSPLNY